MDREGRAGMGNAGGRIGRRAFLGKSGVLTDGAALATTARSYAKILGTNDRISLGHIGVGNRGRGLVEIVGALRASHNVEVTAVCGLWRVNRERAVAANARHYAERGPRGREQGGGGVELPWAAVARAPRGRADPRGGHGLAEVAHGQAVPAVRSPPVLRVPPLPGVLERHPGPMDEPRHRPRALVHGGELPALGGGPTAVSSPGRTAARTRTPSTPSSSTRRASS